MTATTVGINTQAGAVSANVLAAAGAPLPATPPVVVVSAAAVVDETGGPITSPRAVIDPSAGLVLQYLNSDGTLQSQSPSSAVVAYLKAGLTPDGLSKQPANTTGSSSSGTVA